ncbi:MAG: hypothetical protein AAGA38_03405 [Pseudomonadota bacterium]
MRYVFFGGLILLVGCSQEAAEPAFELPPETDTDEVLPFFGDGYPMPGDPCRRIGENAYTNQFLDDAADFIGCPDDMETLEAFVSETGALPVARTQGTVLFSVPRR